MQRSALVRTLVFVALAGVLLFGLGCWFSVEPKPAPILSPFPEATGKAIEIDLETTKLLTTWATALVGGLAAAVIGKESRLGVVGPLQHGLFIGCALACCCSLFGGHYVQSRMAEMLSEQFYARTDQMISRPRTVQYWGFLVGVALFASLVMSVLNNPRPAATVTSGENT